MPDAVSSSSVVRDLIAAQVTRAEEVFGSLRKQSLAIVGVAGGLLALVSGFLTLAGLSRTTRMPPEARTTISWALGAYVAATVAALLVHLPNWVKSMDAKAFEQYMNDHWDASSEAWTRAVADLEVSYLKSLNASNSVVAWFFVGAVLLEVVGIGLTGWAAIQILGSL